MISIEELLKDYDRDKGKWNLPDSEIAQRQYEIRKLRFQIQADNENYLAFSGSPAEQAKYLPLVLRRQFYSKTQAVNSAGELCLSPEDGEHWKFSESDTFNHSRGNWNCKACTPEGAEIQLGWCPKFLSAIASVGPVKYAALFRKNNPDLAICYAGLMHVQSTITDTEIKWTKKCDTCGFETVEVRQLAKQFDPLDFVISADLGHRNDDITIMTVNCTECGEIMCQIPMDKLPNDWGEKQILPVQYEAEIDKHWKEKHPQPELKVTQI